MPRCPAPRIRTRARCSKSERCSKCASVKTVSMLRISLCAKMHMLRYHITRGTLTQPRVERIAKHNLALNSSTLNQGSLTIELSTFNIELSRIESSLTLNYLPTHARGRDTRARSFPHSRGNLRLQKTFLSTRGCKCLPKRTKTPDICLHTNGFLDLRR